MILADATLRDAQSYRSDGRTVVSEALSGEYRYVKLLWLNGGSNSDVKTIVGISLYAEGETPAESPAPDMTALLTLYNQVKSLNNGGKMYTSTTFRRLTLSIAEVGKLLANPQKAVKADVVSAEAALRAAYEGLTEQDPAFRGPVDGGKTDPPTTGSVLPSAVLTVLVSAIALVAATKKKRRKEENG